VSPLPSHLDKNLGHVAAERVSSGVITISAFELSPRGTSPNPCLRSRVIAQSRSLVSKTRSRLVLLSDCLDENLSLVDRGEALERFHG
jgi:hypothetical protein